MVFVSFKMKQVLQMLWTWAIGDKKVICALVEAGKLRAFVDRSFPLDETAEAHRYAESGAKHGSVVIVLGPESEDPSGPT
jgi:NADPH:quinone reductase-like Zn-dependent oxidoreductase